MANKAKLLSLSNNPAERRGETKSPLLCYWRTWNGKKEWCRIHFEFKCEGCLNYVRTRLYTKEQKDDKER